MLVSVILPNYNHAQYLKQRIDTILNQSYQNFEVIILDDCSTDNSRDIINEYRDEDKILKVICNDSNSGSPFKQWNKGIRAAKGELIWIAESDDFASADFLQNLQSEFEQDQRLGIAYAQSNMVNEKNEITGSWQFWTNDLDPELFKNRFKMSGKEYIDRFLIYKNTIPNASAVLFKKKLYEIVGGADESISQSGDWLMWLKILTKSNIAYIPHHLNNFRYHDTSVIAKARETATEKFLGSDNIKMRSTLHNFFEEKLAENKNFKTIITKNYNLLLKERAKEAYYHVSKKNGIKGLSLLIKISFSSMRNFLFILHLFVKKTFYKIKGAKR